MRHSMPHLGPTAQGAEEAGTALIDCVDWDRPRTYTRGELADLIARVAAALAQRGLRAGARVAIASANSADFLVAHFAILRAGLVCVPVNHKLHPDTLAFILDDCAVELVLCDAPRRACVPAGMPLVEFGSPAWLAMTRSRPQPLPMPALRDTAIILYTSGSTGRPKGVPLDHAGQQWTLKARSAAGAGHGGHRMLVAAPLYHMNGLGNAVFMLCSGGTLVLLPAFDAVRYIVAIERFRLTWLTSVPTMLAMVFKHPELLASTDLSSVRIVRMGSAAFTPQLLADVRRTFPAATVGNAYGTTETGSIAFGPSPGGTAPPDLSLGWPQPEVQVRLVDDAGNEAAQGELWMRTPATMKGYLHLPERSAEVLTPDGWYRTGDLVRRDEAGACWFVGRIDDMFNCGGENVFPGEVERLLERHAGVLQACVVAVPDEIKGHKPFAFVVLQPGAAPTEHELRQFALAHGPAYQHPRRIVFLPALPLSGTHKIDRASLTAQALRDNDVRT